MNNTQQRITIESLRKEVLNPGTYKVFSEFIREKSKIQSLPMLKNVLQTMLRKDNFMAEYITLCKNTQGTEYLSDFMKNYIDTLSLNPDDKDGFLLCECFFYGFLFLSEKCRLSEHIFMTTLCDFTESFGFALVDNLLEVALKKKLSRVEERLRFLYLFYSDDEQLRKLLIEKKDSWSIFTLLYLFLAASDSSRAKYLKHDLVVQPPSEIAGLLEEDRRSEAVRRAIGPDTLLLGLLGPGQGPTKEDNLNHLNPEFILQTLKEVVKRPGSRDLIENLFGLYQGLMEAQRTRGNNLSFDLVKSCIMELDRLISASASKTPVHSLNELKVLKALYCNTLVEFSDQTKADQEFLDKVVTNLMELIKTENGFSKYVGISVFMTLAMKGIRKKVKDDGNSQQYLNLMKVCYKGLNSEPDPHLFAFRSFAGWRSVFEAINRLLDEQLGDEKRRVSRIQDYLKKVEEEFATTRGGNNDMNNEVWRFLKKLP